MNSQTLLLLLLLCTASLLLTAFSAEKTSISIAHHSHEQPKEKKTETDPGGGIQFITDLWIQRNKTNCDRNGSFFVRHFFWTDLGKPYEWADKPTEQMPAHGYRLRYQEGTEFLIHSFSSPGLHLTGQNCTLGKDDYESCTFYWEGSQSTTQYPNCYVQNRVVVERLRFRYCPAGYYFKGLIDRMCDHCPDGQYSDGMNKDLTCKPCSFPTDGTFCYLHCPAGQYQQRNETCAKCPVGTFNPKVDQTECKKCSDADPHQYQDQEGQIQCKVCGHVTLDGTRCTTCHQGQYWDRSGDNCLACPPGTYNDETSTQREQCKPCTGYQYSDVSGSTSCKTCGHLPTFNNAKCLACNAGQHWQSGDSCVQCTPGTYNDEPVTELSQCKQCSGQQYSDISGATSCKTCAHDTDHVSCKFCPAGQHWASGGACEPCSPGTFKDRDSDETQCTLCPDFFFAPNPGSTRCEKCDYPTDYTRTICAPPCPYDGTGTRGQIGKEQRCLCPQNPKQYPVTQVTLYKDSSNLCTVGINEHAISENGGLLVYQNGQFNINFNGTIDTMYGVKLLPKQQAFTQLEDKPALPTADGQIANQFIKESKLFNSYTDLLEEYVLSSEPKSEEDYTLRHLVIAEKVSRDKSLPFIAKPNKRFLQKSFEEIKKSLFGSKSRPLTADANSEEIVPQVNKGAPINQLPTEFDMRKAHPYCNVTIWDQGTCGSCVSVAVTSALSDRLCVATKGKINEPLSPQYLLDCVHKDCVGWYTATGHRALISYGAPTNSCYPYTSGKRGVVYSCRSTCVDGSSMTNYYAKSNSLYELVSETSRKTALVEHGSITVDMTVFEDLLVYSDGVYVHKYGRKIEDHSVRVIGWGVEDGIQYWLITNSWGTDFGQNGVVKIAMSDAGTNLRAFYSVEVSV